jgi:hypothetical protein
LHRDAEENGDIIVHPEILADDLAWTDRHLGLWCRFGLRSLGQGRERAKAKERGQSRAAAIALEIDGDVEPSSFLSPLRFSFLIAARPLLVVADPGRNRLETINRKPTE